MNARKFLVILHRYHFTITALILPVALLLLLLLTLLIQCLRSPGPLPDDNPPSEPVQANLFRDDTKE